MIENPLSIMGTVDRSIRWIAEEKTDDRVTFRVGRSGSNPVAEFVGVGTVEAAPDGSWSRFLPAPTASEQQVEKLERGLVRALIAQLRHQLAFHASAAERGGRAVVCLGPSEAGKSTAVAELCRRNGFALLADDAVILQRSAVGFDILPTEDSHWLLDASSEALGFHERNDYKGRVRPRVAAQRPAKLVAICKLEFDDAAIGPSLSRLHGQSILAALTAAAIRLVVDEPSRHVREFEQLVELTKAVDVYELRRPRDLRRLSDTGDLLARLLGS